MNAAVLVDGYAANGFLGVRPWFILRSPVIDQESAREQVAATAATRERKVASGAALPSIHCRESPLLARNLSS